MTEMSDLCYLRKPQMTHPRPMADAGKGVAISVTSVCLCICSLGAILQDCAISLGKVSWVSVREHFCVRSFGNV